MHPSLVKLVAWVLLALQAMVAPAHGRVLCIPLPGCDEHETGLTEACGHGDAHALDSENHGDRSREFERFPVAIAPHPDEECGCHVHLPVPSEEWTAGSSKPERGEARAVFEAQGVGIDAGWGRDAFASHAAWHAGPDFRARDQVLALKATRLLL